MARRHHGDDVTVTEECAGTPPGDSSAADKMAAFDRRLGDDVDDGGDESRGSYEVDMRLLERVSTKFTDYVCVYLAYI